MINADLGHLRPKQRFKGLRIKLPGKNGGGLRGLMKDENIRRGFFFRDGTFESHQSVRESLCGLRGLVEHLCINKVQDLRLLEDVAVSMGVRTVCISFNKGKHDEEYLGAARSRGWEIEKSDQGKVRFFEKYFLAPSLSPARGAMTDSGGSEIFRGSALEAESLAN